MPKIAKPAHRKKAAKHPEQDINDLRAVKESLILLENRQIEQAKQICQQVLQRAPALSYAHHAWGLIAMQEHHYQEAEVALRKATTLSSDNADYLIDLAEAVLKQDRIDEAIKFYEQVIAIDADNQLARTGLVNALQAKDDLEALIAYFEEAIKREPDAPGPLSCLGKVLINAQRFQEAFACLFKALELQINFVPAHISLGTAFREMGMLPAALECYQTALLLNPADISAHLEIANTYLKQQEYDEAHQHYQRIIELAPHNSLGYAQLASSYFFNQDRYEEAMALYSKALEMDPKNALLHNNIGVLKLAYGEPEAAIDYFRLTLAMKPHYTMAQQNLAFAQLLFGNLKEGWFNHEIRFAVKERRAVYDLIHKVFLIIPKWDGSTSLQGKFILLMHEQGYGDSIQFVRYVRLLLEQGARVALHVKEPLARLFASIAPEVTLVREKDPLPPCDYAYVLMSLPYALGTNRIEDIPAYPSYLAVEPADSAQWADKIASITNHTHQLRVGLAWAGNPTHVNDRNRSIPLTILSSLFVIPEIQFFSLQKGEPVMELGKLAATVIDLGKDCADFADTAAAIENLDLVISVDTAVAHLAGALGKLTWILLPVVPDWRWLQCREDSPWYPSVRLFRQEKRMDWMSVINKVATELVLLRDSRRAE